MLAHHVVLLPQAADVCLPSVYPEQRRVTPLESTLVEVFILNSLNPFRMNTCHAKPHFAQFWCNVTPFRINTCKSVSKQTTLSTFRINTYEKTGGADSGTRHQSVSTGVMLKFFAFVLLRTLWQDQKLNSFLFNRFHTLCTKTPGVGDVLLPDRLLTPGGGSSHGVIHIAAGLFARITLALVAAFKVFQIVLKNFCASLAQAFSGSLVQCSLGPLLGSTIRMLTELHDSVVSAPIVLILPLALSRDLLFQGVDQKIVGPQDENEPRDPKNGEPLEHDAEPIASPMLSLADYSLRQAASAEQSRRTIAKFRLGESAGLMGSNRRGKTFIGGVFVEVQELRGALEQIAGQIAGLIVHPPGGVDEIDFAAGTNLFEGTEPVQDRFDLAQVAFGQHQQKIVFGKAGREIGAATGLLQAPGELFQSRIRCRQAVPFGGLGEIVQVDGSQAQRRILPPRARDLFAELLLD